LIGQFDRCVIYIVCSSGLISGHLIQFSLVILELQNLLSGGGYT